MSRAEFLAKRSDAKRRAVLAAARERFAADGYNGASVEQIAQTAEVSTATLYKLFPSKLELFGAVWRAELDVFVETLDETPELKLKDKPAALARAYAHLLADPVRAGLLRAMLAATSVQDLSKVFFEDVREKIGANFAAMAEELHAKKLIRVADAEEARFATSQLMGMVEHFLLWGVLFAKADPKGAPDDIAARATQTFWAAYGAKR